MISTRAWRLLGLAATGALTAATPALAQDGRHFYGGLSIGQSRADLDEARIAAGRIPAGVAVGAVSIDQRDTAYKVFGGYQFHPRFALEAGYFNLGRFGLSATTVPAGTIDGEVRLQGVNIDLVGNVPLVGQLSALGRVGAQYARTHDTFTGSGAASVLDPNPSRRKTNYKVGAGLQYAFTPAILARGEIEHYRVRDAVGGPGSVNVLSLSLVFPFGHRPAPPRASRPHRCRPTSPRHPRRRLSSSPRRGPRRSWPWRCPCPAAA